MESFSLDLSDMFECLIHSQYCSNIYPVPNDQPGIPMWTFDKVRLNLNWIFIHPKYKLTLLCLLRSNLVWLAFFPKLINIFSSPARLRGSQSSSLHWPAPVLAYFPADSRQQQRPGPSLPRPGWLTYFLLLTSPHRLTPPPQQLPKHYWPHCLTSNIRPGQ